MKVCKRCGEVNEDKNLICKNADCFSREFDDYEKVSNDVKSNLRNKEKLKKNLEIGLLVVYFLIILIVGVLNFKELMISKVIATIALSIIGILCVKFTGFIFEIQHAFSLKDSSGDNMSDMYESYLKVLGILALIYSVYLLF
ncbi:hypothetical protein GNF80_01085 [Clostridium perfringens]|nr:hypothetical protein [Clostridium perfringens]